MVLITDKKFKKKITVVTVQKTPQIWLIKNCITVYQASEDKFPALQRENPAFKT
jgi:hypothetical protein